MIEIVPASICPIHKIAYTKTETEEPIPFAGVVKLTTYKCPMCTVPIEETEYEKERS
tara:strand:- start:25 stop:195 length:171 start_codon:yes stop_codon:yes gene_type:complete